MSTGLDVVDHRTPERWTEVLEHLHSIVDPVLGRCIESDVRRRVQL